ncbi:MAG TPA: FecR domain-containing protein [Pyrinomonadaceae bacterium]|nr:FecR domain-containing protein [Pyrinomonadaceae bacterium]
MFGQQHFQDQLTAYAHGELTAEQAARVAVHLDACVRCRTEFEKITHGMRLLESLSTQAAPASLWDNIEAALAQESSLEVQTERAMPHATGEKGARRAPRETDVRHAGPEKDARRGWLGSFSPVRFNNWRTAFATSLVLLFVLGAGGASWLYLRSTRTSWEVARLAGAPLIDADRIGSTGRLGIGEWLETDADSRAQIKVADIGQVEIDPGTRVRLVETRLTEHRLELARGRMHATIFAPPRLFFVETPSAVAADLGCAYTLEVDDAGRSLLHVTSGWVAFETAERESIVPAGAACVTEPGRGPGTPFFEDASELFLASLAKFDFADGGPEALNIVISEARPRDTLTLWHLLARTAGDERLRVYERLAALAPPPAGVTREGIMLLDPAMLYEWKAQMEQTWLTESMPTIRRAWRTLWTHNAPRPAATPYLK